MSDTTASDGIFTEGTLRQDAPDISRAAALSMRKSIPPARVNGYDIEECLGEGAYGSVWLAAEHDTGKKVAIKFYSHRRGLDWSLLNREVEKLAELYTCRDVIGLLKVGWNADPPYYVMEYLENGSLARKLEQGPLPPSEAVRMVTAVTQALVHAHQNSILHCDLKPANILLDSTDAPRLADFGQSRLSYEQDPALGTLFYMAPEQADLNAIPDARWDVFALGALLYHALCGVPPFRNPEHEKYIQAATTLEERLARYRRVLLESPRPQQHRLVPGVDSELALIVDRCLEIDPALRLPHAQAVWEALAARAKRRSRRPLIWLGIIAPILLLLAVLPLVVRAMEDTVQAAERNLAFRALESDVVTAKILALAVQNDLEQRIAELQDVAADPKLRTALAGGPEKMKMGPDREELRDFLNQRKDRIDFTLSQRHSVADDSWFVTDAQGIQRWRNPPSDESNDKQYAWRDYFHGRGREYDKNEVPTGIEPIRKPHISLAFRSQTTDQYRVALTVPVWDVEQKHVVGVLGRSINLGQLLTDYKRLVRGQDSSDDVNRIIGIVDLRTGRILDHPWLTPENLRQLSSEQFEQLSLRETQSENLQKLVTAVRRGTPVRGEDRETHYHDPVGRLDEKTEEVFGMTWLAAFWPVGTTGWVAVVQERREQALQPVREIRNGLIRYALAGVGLCVAVVGLVWYFVWRSLTGRELRRRASLPPAGTLPHPPRPLAG